MTFPLEILSGPFCGRLDATAMCFIEPCVKWFIYSTSYTVSYVVVYLSSPMRIKTVLISVRNYVLFQVLEVRNVKPLPGPGVANYVLPFLLFLQPPSSSWQNNVCGDSAFTHLSFHPQRCYRAHLNSSGIPFFKMMALFSSLYSAVWTRESVVEYESANFFYKGPHAVSVPCSFCFVVGCCLF